MLNRIRQTPLGLSQPSVVLIAGLLVCLSSASSALDEVDEPTPSQAAGTTAEPTLSIGVRNSRLDYTFFHAGGIRYFVTEILLTNHSDEVVTVPIDSIELVFDGLVYRPDNENSKLTGYEFRANGQSRRFSNLPKVDTLQVPAGEAGSAWVVYTGLPKTPDIPELALQFTLDVAKYSFDIDAHYARQLALNVKRIGPHDVLGLLTIHGQLNTINIGTLTAELDQLASAQVSRAVVRFGGRAAEVDERIANWLRERADGNETSRNYRIYPAIVSTIREFHLAQIPTHSASDRSSVNEHDSAAAAVEAALASAYRGLPAELIVQQIEEGHRFAQASALSGGGGELPARFLPLLLDRTRSDDSLLRRSAYIALGGHRQPQAIDALERGALSTEEETATIAVECLAASRYDAAHDRLKSLLDEPLGVARADLVRILARHPRRQWSDYLSRLARGDQTDNEPSVRQEALRALGRIGHPDLTDILAGALDEQSVRDTAFQLLLSRNDDASVRLATEHALSRLNVGPPTAQMLQLFDRVRDPRATPKLIVHLDDDASDRSALINTLARIGTAGIDQILAERFDSLKPNEQAVVLTCLVQLRSPRLIPLSRSAMQSEHDAVFNGAWRALSLLADSASVAILAAQLQEEQDESRVKDLAKALEAIGTHPAAYALQTAKQSSQGEKQTIIAKHLEDWCENSLGGQHLERADRYVRSEDLEKAIKHYTLALEHFEISIKEYTPVIEHDQVLVRTYTGRGHCRLKLDDYKLAEEDFRRGIEHDPDDGQAVTGLAIALAVLGDAEEGIQVVKDADERFADDAIYAYNVACVYGRALERIPLDSSPEQQQKLRREYAEAAIERLKRSIDLGFQDLEFMKADPDLFSLHTFDEFQSLLNPGDDSTQPPESDTIEPMNKPIVEPKQDVVVP